MYNTVVPSDVLVSSSGVTRFSDVTSVALAKDAGASEVSIGNYRKIDRAFVKKILDAGIKVNVWQVENLDDLVYAAKIGALRVCSNHAYRLREDFKILKELDFK